MDPRRGKTRAITKETTMSEEQKPLIPHETPADKSARLQQQGQPRLTVVPSSHNLRVALEHADAGFPVFPAELKLKPRGKWDKTPLVKWKSATTTDPNQIRAWWHQWPDAAPGVPLEICNLIVLDPDRHGPTDGVAAFEQLIAQHEPLPLHPVTHTAGDGEHHIFRQPSDRKLGNSTGKLPAGIDVRGGDKGWVVAPGTLRPDGKRWEPGTPSLIEAQRANTIPELPPWLVNILTPPEAPQPGKPRPATEFEREFATRALTRYAAELAKMEPDSGRNNRLYYFARCMGEMYAAGWIDEATAEAALLDACNKNGLSDDGERGVKATFRSGWSAGLLKPRAPLIEAPFNSEEFLALMYVAQYGEDLRYVAKWNHWMVWDDKRWLEDDKRTSFRDAREICRDAALKLDKGGGRLANARTRAAIVSLAQDDAKIAATIGQWNTDPWSLNTPGGTVDLHTGELREHRREDYITKMTAVTPEKLPTPRWTKFLTEITSGDAELLLYLQRLAGYVLTGITREHMFTFFYGSNGNGKSTFINALIGILGEFHRVIPLTALLSSHHEQHPTELAGLMGARLVTCSEVERGRNWNEPQIKRLSGGDIITARFMQRNFFDFYPQFKLVIIGNDKPGLRSVDEAIRRRTHLVPFIAKFEGAQLDRQLEAKLKLEWSGILQWMIDGCLEWQRVGLAPPKAVIEATDEYLEAQDSIGAFLEEQCVAERREQAASSGLFQRWVSFCEDRGERPGHSKTFNDALEKKGFKRVKTAKGFVFLGLRLKDKEVSSPERPGAPPY
jgi:putative DNA primase/helicase